LLPGFCFELFAQLSDKDAQIFGLMGRLRAPDGGQQCAMRNYLAGVAGKMEQQIEFLGREVNGPAKDGDGVCG